MFHNSNDLTRNRSDSVPIVKSDDQLSLIINKPRAHSCNKPEVDNVVTLRTGIPKYDMSYHEHQRYLKKFVATTEEEVTETEVEGVNTTTPDVDLYKCRQISEECLFEIEDIITSSTESSIELSGTSSDLTADTSISQPS